MIKSNNPVKLFSLTIRWTLAFMVVFVLVSCSSPSLRKDSTRPIPSFAKNPASSGPLADMAQEIFRVNGSEYSGFKLLDKSYDGLLWRLALIDSATSSLDIQTYLWYPDNVGRLVLERAVHAANRGVHVRIIVDDLLTVGLGQLMYELESHKNIEMRIFNPWENRDVLSRAGEMVAQMERLNTRMHDKLLIADGNAAIIGGRNIGDHYYGLSEAYNFHDFDLLGFGHISRQANTMFDSFWNSDWVYSVKNLDTKHDTEFVSSKWQEIQEKNRSSEKLELFGVKAKNWSKELTDIAGELQIGTSRLIFDEAKEDDITQNVAAKIFNIMGTAQQELLITNAYIVPGQPAIDFIQSLTDRGVSVRILTNSLASHDVPAVNSHFEDWRDDLINAGAELYELKSDPQIRSVVEIPPNKAQFIGLHAKAIVIDRKKVFVGSMNLDPRSFAINTEAGAVVNSPELGGTLARIMERDMLPQNSWQVLLNSEGKPYWVSGDETLDSQPARNGGQRIMNEIFKMFPKEQY